MSVLLAISLVINICLCAMALLNLATIIRPKVSANTALSFSILVPCRNEAENVSELVQTLAALDHPDYEVIFIDDNSTDGTGDMLHQAIANDQRMKAVSAEALPSDWMGKPWALSQGFARAKNEFIVTVDADVRLAPSALSAMDATLRSTDSDFLSPYPAQVAQTFSERLVQPLLQWSWMTTVPLRHAMKSSRTSLAVANGQFFIIRKSALIQAGGFSAIKKSVLDDIDLARALMRGGYKGGVCNGSAIASTRMYSSFSEIRAGYGKSLATGFGGLYGSIAVAILVALSGVVPFIFSFGSSTLATISLLLVIASRVISAIAFRSLLIDALLHPVSAVIFIYLLFYSNFYGSKITWKDRPL